jgi:hypothetical protein
MLNIKVTLVKPASADTRESSKTALVMAKTLKIKAILISRKCELDR